MQLLRVLHVFRNTPLGRETLLGTIHLCRRTGMQLYLYRPEESRVTLQFENELVEVTLDSSYVRDRETAERHAEEIARSQQIPIHWVEPQHRLASTLPVIVDDFDLMTSPRSLIGPSQGGPLALLGARVRRLIRSAHHPVVVQPAPLLLWDRIVVFFAGSSHALCALAWARALAAAAGVEYRVFTQEEGPAVERATAALQAEGLLEEVRPRWTVWPRGPFENVLWEVPRTSLVVAGAFGSSGVKSRLFGSRTETLLSQLPNPLFLVGPNATTPRHG